MVPYIWSTYGGREGRIAGFEVATTISSNVTPAIGLQLTPALQVTPQYKNARRQ